MYQLLYKSYSTPPRLYDDDYDSLTFIRREYLGICCNGASNSDITAQDARLVL